MIIKQCQFSGKDEDGIYFNILRPGYKNSHIVKNASARDAVMAEINSAMDAMPRSPNLIYTLISAMGASEYWGQNTNGDIFPERALIHTPPNWGELSVGAKPQVGRRWEWGYPTFYNAHAFQHHVNKDPERAFGNVVYATWDPFMKRVLLIVSFDRKKADQMGAISVIDKVENGEFPETSMGCKVPFDLCSICTDWDRITGNPKVDLENHRKNPIRGLSETTKDYCEHLVNNLGRVYSDGRKAGMYNLHPRFFDISIVFIGADRTSKIMAKLAGRCPIRTNSPACGKCKDCDISSAHVYDVRSRSIEKVASSKVKGNDEMLKQAFFVSEGEYTSPREEKALNRYFSRWKKKQAEIEKEVKSNFEPMLSSMDSSEDDLPEDAINEISRDIPKGLASAGSIGIILKPREFQRTMLISIGKKPLADDLDSRGMCFRRGMEPDRMISLGDSIVPSLIKKLLPLVAGRSGFGPTFHKRIIITVGKKGDESPRSEELEHPLLDKIGAAYSDYRRQLLHKVASSTQRLVHEYPEALAEFFPQAVDISFTDGLAKLGGNVMESLIGMMPTMYLNRAYLDEPVSRYVDAHPNLEGIVTADVLSTRGRVA